MIEAVPNRVRGVLIDLGLLGVGLALVLGGTVVFGGIIAAFALVVLARDLSTGVRRISEGKALTAAFWSSLSVSALVDLALDLVRGVA